MGTKTLACFFDNEEPQHNVHGKQNRGRNEDGFVPDIVITTS